MPGHREVPAPRNRKVEGMTPIQRSKKKWEDLGFLVAIVERWNPWSKTRQDLFGWMDLLVIKGDMTVGIQTTTAAHINERIIKIKSLQSSDLWLNAATRRIVVEGWSKKGPRRKRKTWCCTEHWL